MSVIIARLMILTGLVLIAFGAHEYIAPAIYQEYLRQQYLASPPLASRTVFDPAAAATVSLRRVLPADVVARLMCPRLKREFYILPDQGQNLKKGPVWLNGTSRPGTLGNVIFAAHRDTHFSFLRYIRVGDVFQVDSARGDLTYKVTRINIVNKDNVQLLAPQQSGMLTLVTCYPFFFIGNAPQRFIVRAELVKQEKKNE